MDTKIPVKISWSLIVHYFSLYFGEVLTTKTKLYFDCGSTREQRLRAEGVGRHWSDLLLLDAIISIHRGNHPQVSRRLVNQQEIFRKAFMTVCKSKMSGCGSGFLVIDEQWESSHWGSFDAFEKSIYSRHRKGDEKAALIFSKVAEQSEGVPLPSIAKSAITKIWNESSQSSDVHMNKHITSAISTFPVDGTVNFDGSDEDEILRYLFDNDLGGLSQDLDGADWDSWAEHKMPQLKHPGSPDANEEDSVSGSLTGFGAQRCTLVDERSECSTSVEERSDRSIFVDAVQTIKSLDERAERLEVGLRRLLSCATELTKRKREDDV